TALRIDTLVIPVFTGDLSPDVLRSLPYGLATRQGIRLEAGTAGMLDRLAEQVAASIMDRRRAQSAFGPGPSADPEAESAELAATSRLVREAFERAGWQLRRDELSPRMLWPGPVW